MWAKFKGNLIMHLNSRVIICKHAKIQRKTWKKEKKIKKMSDFEGSYIPQKWLVQFTSNLVCVLSWYVQAPAQQIWSCSDKRSRSYKRAQNRTLFFMLIHSGCVHAPFPWAIWHTTTYLLNSRIIWSPSTKLIKFSSCFMYVCWSFVTTHQFSLKTVRSDHY